MPWLLPISTWSGRTLTTRSAWMPAGFVPSLVSAWMRAHISPQLMRRSAVLMPSFSSQRWFMASEASMQL